MDDLYDGFMEALNDDDPQFRDDDDLHYLELQLDDTEFLRGLLTEDGHDPLGSEKYREIYGDGYDIYFYAEYYPKTDHSVQKVRLSVLPRIFDEDLAYDIKDKLFENKDRVDEHGYINLSEKEQAALLHAIEVYAEKEIEEFEKFLTDIEAERD